MNTTRETEKIPEVAEGIEIIEVSKELVEKAIGIIEKRVDLEGSARYSGAIVRRRVIQSALNLLRMVMTYVLTDSSLSLVGIWGTVMGWGSLSKNGVRKRLQGCDKWIGMLIVMVLTAGKLSLPRRTGMRVRLFDASVISRPGSQKGDWRLHLSYDLLAGRIDDVQLTSMKEGESLTRWQFSADEICLADRCYGVPRSLGVLLSACAYFVIRMGWQNLPLQDGQGRPFSVSAWLRVQSSDPAAHPSQVSVWVRTPQGRFPIRLIARAIPPEKAERNRQNMLAEAKRKHRSVDERSLLAAGFVMVVSNLPELSWSASQILDLYRFRWQIELVFKRLKSLLDLDHLRVTQDARLAQVYLLTKILVALLLGEMQWQIVLSDPDAFQDPAHPISPWRLTQLLYKAFQHAMIGTLTFELIQNNSHLLARYLCDSPRKRRSQFADRARLEMLCGF
jgi:hypothetical protein